MKKIVSISVILFVSIHFLFAQSQKVKRFSVSGYNGVEVHNAMDIKLIQDGTESASVKCDERLIPAILVEKKGKILSIDFDWDVLDEICGTSSFFGFFSERDVWIDKDYVKINGTKFEGGIELLVHAKNINKLGTSSSGDILIEGDLKSDNLEIDISSAGDITWKGLCTADKVNISVSSAGDVLGDIKATKVDVELSSAGDFKSDIEAGYVSFDISSAGNYKGTIHAKEGRFELSSAGDVYVDGSIDKLFVTAGSASTFSGTKLKYEHAEVESGSAADVYLSKKNN